MKIYDKDLDFLNDLGDKELKGLYEILVFGDKEDVEKGDKRFNESLSDKLVADNYKDIAGEIIEDFKMYGGNTIANLFRGGKGVEYKEILLDVCGKFKVKPGKYRSVEEIEQELIESIIKQSIAHMSADELEQLAKASGINYTPDLPISQAITASMIYAFKAGGFKSYQLTVILANIILKALIGRGLSFAGNALLVRTMAILTGPVGWVITGVWTAVDIAGPAYRVTIPCVVEIILLRNLYKANKIDSNWVESITNL